MRPSDYVDRLTRLAALLVFCTTFRHTIRNKSHDRSSPRSEEKASGWLQSAVTTIHVIYRAPSLQPTSYFLSSSVISCTFSVLCVYSKFGHHIHPLGYHCAKFRFCAASIAELAHGEKSRTQSLNQSPGLADAPGKSLATARSEATFPSQQPANRV